jgi:hypothetical protein
MIEHCVSPLTAPAFRPFKPRAVSIEGTAVCNELVDCFVVFVRNGARRPEAAERPVAAYASYEEADEVRQHLRRSGRWCIIRFVGPTGGGD